MTTAQDGGRRPARSDAWDTRGWETAGWETGHARPSGGGTGPGDRHPVGGADRWRGAPDSRLAHAARPPHAHDRGRAQGDGDGSLGQAVIRGVAAGTFGALAMLLTHKLSSKVVAGSADAVPTPGEQLAEEAAERVGHHLPESAEMAAGAGISLGAGALVGAVFGAVQHAVPVPPLLHGLLLSGVSYAVTVPDGGLLPRLGLTASSHGRGKGVGRAMVPVDAHLAFGVATAAAYEALG